MRLARRGAELRADGLDDAADLVLLAAVVLEAHDDREDPMGHLHVFGIFEDAAREPLVRLLPVLDEHDHDRDVAGLRFVERAVPGARPPEHLARVRLLRDGAAAATSGEIAAGIFTIPA